MDVSQPPPVAAVCCASIRIWLDEGKSQQARTKQRHTQKSHCQKTERSEFVAHVIIETIQSSNLDYSLQEAAQTSAPTNPHRRGHRASNGTRFSFRAKTYARASI